MKKANLPLVVTILEKLTHLMPGHSKLIYQALELTSDAAWEIQFAHTILKETAKCPRCKNCTRMAKDFLRVQGHEIEGEDNEDPNQEEA